MKTETDKLNKEEAEKYLNGLKDSPLFLDTLGKLATKNDETRIVWFSVRCTYWTDDWNKLIKVYPHGIPLCPNCKSPGMQAEWKDWIKSANRYDKQVAPKYMQFIMYVKEKCITQQDGKPVPPKEVYKVWYSQLDKGIKSLDDALSDGINNISEG